MNTARRSLPQLRQAIQNNELSFPAQLPMFQRQSRADIQWKAAELYFIRNWNTSAIAKRYGVKRARMDQIIRGWYQRAALLGYIQEIPSPSRLPEGLSMTAGSGDRSAPTMSHVPMDFIPEAARVSGAP